MNRHPFAILLCAAALSSCIKSDDNDPGESVILDKYHTTRSFEVPVEGDGTVSQVIYHRTDGDREVLATTDVPLTIQVPAWITDVRSGENDEYIEVVKLARAPDGFFPGTYVKDGNSVLMFEDSRFGDFDYNDLVLYVRHSVAGNNKTSAARITIYVKPIAMGSGSLIAFGWEDGNGEHMLTDDVRRDYFGGRAGFINTDARFDMTEPIEVADDGSGNEVRQGYTVFRDRALMERARSQDPVSDLIVGGYIKYDPVPTTCSSASNDTKMIKWFIKVGGNKFFVAAIDKSAPAGTFPYGLAIANVAYHACERTPVWEAYPGFRSWIETGAPLNWSNDRARNKCYEKHVNYARW